MVRMNAIMESECHKEELDATPKPTGYIAIGLRQTDRGLRMVRLFTTETLPREFQDDFPAQTSRPN